MSEAVISANFMQNIALNDGRNAYFLFDYICPKLFVKKNPFFIETNCRVEFVMPNNFYSCLPVTEKRIYQDCPSLGLA